MAYVPTNWVDNVTPLSAQNLNHIEQGIKTHGETPATESLSAHVELATQTEASVGRDTGRAITPATLKGIWRHEAIPSYNTRASLDTEVDTNSTVYVKRKSFTMKASGMFRVSFCLYTHHGNYYAYGRIYKNGIPFGTEQSTKAPSESPAIYSEDLAFEEGDTCELWIKDQSGHYRAAAYNFRISFDMERILNFDIASEEPEGEEIAE